MAAPPDRASAQVNAADSTLASSPQTHDRSASMSNWNRTKPTSTVLQAGTSANTALSASSPARPIVSSSPSASTSSGTPQPAGTQSSSSTLSASTGSIARVSGDEQIRVGTTESGSKHTRDTSRSQVAVQMLASDIRDSPELQHIFNVLAANNFTERDVWEGNPAVYPVIESVKDRMAAAQLDPGKPQTLALHFSSEDFTKQGVNTKLYKLERDKPIYQIISAICKKFGVPNYRRYSFQTLAGFTLEDNDVLATYGFGSLMRYWELKLVRKTPEQYAKAVSASSSDYYIVTFILPSNIPQFNGLSQRIQKVKASMPTGDIIALLCKRYKVNNPEQFAITSVDDFVFSRSEGLEYYGLGKKFDKMTVKMATVAQLSKQHRVSMRLANPEFAWTQVDDQLDIREARAVILDMDKQLGFAAEKTSQLRAELEQTKNDLKKVTRSRDVVSEERDHIVAQAKKLIEIYVATKGKQEGLQMEKTRNLTEIESLKGQIDRLKQQFSQERSALEQKAKALALELLAERGRSSAFQKDYENSQERVASLEATLSRVKDAMVRASTEIKTLRATEISLGEEIETLNAEIAQRRVSENQLTQDVSDLKAEKQQLQSTLDATYAERDELAQKLTDTREEMDAFRKLTEKEKLALRSEIETLELKMADEASQARLVLSETRHELEDAEAKVEEGNRKLLLAEQQRKQLETQFDNERQGFQESIERLRSAFAAKRAELEQKMEQQMNQAASADSALSELNGEVSSLRKERDNLNNQLAQQEQAADKVKADLEGKIRRLEDELAAQAAFPGATGSGESSEALKRIREQALQLQREVDMLRLQSKQAQDRTALVEKDLELTNTRVKELNEANEKYRLELSKTKQEMDRATNTVGTLQTQLDQTRQTLEKEQKTSIEIQQKANQLEKKVGTLEVTVKSLQEDLDESSKQKEDLSTQLSAAMEYKPRLAAVQKEKQVLEEQWEEQKKSYEERIDKLVKEVEFLSTPPTPPPAMPSPAGSTRSSAAPGGGNAGNLETQIQSMKDALNKIAVSDRKTREVSQMNSMASLIITGLEKRFKLANQDESEAEVLETGNDAAGDDDWLE